MRIYIAESAVVASYLRDEEIRLGDADLHCGIPFGDADLRYEIRLGDLEMRKIPETSSKIRGQRN